MSLVPTGGLQMAAKETDHCLYHIVVLLQQKYAQCAQRWVGPSDRGWNQGRKQGKVPEG